MYTNTQFIKYSWGGSIQKDTEIYFYLICAVTTHISFVLLIGKGVSNVAKVKQHSHGTDIFIT